MRARRWCGIGWMTAALLAGGGGTALAAKAAPDLVVSKLSAPAGSVLRGHALTVTVTVRNAGNGKAGASKLGAYLSKDARKGKGDIALAGARKVGVLRPSRTASARAAFTVPAATAPGTYRLLVCADAARAVKERNEANDCRAAARRLTVTAPAPPVIAPPSPGPATPTPTPPPGGPANPLSVGGETLDTAHAVSGSSVLLSAVPLTTTAADGTKYTLTIPNGGLPSAQTITMTPVTSVSGLPFAGGLVGAVKLEPEGLQLIKSGTLTIEPPTAPPAGSETAFQFHPGGNDLHLYPMESTGRITLPIDHFSTPGVALATDAERATVEAHAPARPSAQLEQSVAELARQERLNVMNGTPDPAFGAKLGALYDDFYDKTVKPTLETATSSDGSDAEQAIATALEWAHESAVLGAGGGEYDNRTTEMWQLIDVVITNAINKGYNACVQDHDLSQIIRLIALQRFAMILGLQSGIDSSAWNKALACGHFEANLDATFTQDVHGRTGGGGPYDQSATWEMAADRVPMDVFGSGSGPLTWRTFSYHSTAVYPGSSCTLITTVDQTTHQDITVSALLQLDLDPRETPPAGQPAPAPRASFLRLSPAVNFSMEGYHSQNSGCSSNGSDFTDFHWYDELGDFHTDPGENRSAIQVKLDPADQVGDELDAVHIQRSKTNGGTTDGEDTYVELFHTPQSSP